MHYSLASPIHGGGGPRKRWKGLASGDNASYSFLHHSGGTPFGGWRHHLCPGGKHVTGFSGRCASLQHGYHRLTGFSGRCCSPTNPVRWCNSSSFATLLKRGHYGRWTLRSICAWSSSEGKTIQPGFTRRKCTPSAACGTKGGRSHRRWLLSADWYLLPFVSNAACTARILHRMRKSAEIGPA